MDKALVLGVVVSGLLLGACDGDAAGGSSITVTREGAAGYSFASAHLECSVSQPDPGAELRLMDCAHGDPDVSGLRLVAFFEGSIAELPAGTELRHGADFSVTTVTGAGGGSIWGAGGDSSWWAGDLTVTLEERTDGAQPATFEGTLETTDVIEAMMLRPIMVDFAGVAATLP